MVRQREAEGRLASAAWLALPDLQRIFAALDGAQARTRAVGGAVRDTLMAHDRTDTDIDLATELLPTDVIERAEAAGIAAYPTGIAHGTVTLRAGNVVAEVTTLREDVDTDGRHAVVRFGTDWRRDAQRRDFTLNALYAGSDGRLFDPLGGLDDCLDGRIRFIGDPDQRIAEDRLRVYRFFRFSASHGHQHFDPAGLEACERASGTLTSLSAERVGTEITRMLGLARVARTLSEMARIDVIQLAARKIEQLEAYEKLAQFARSSGRFALLLSGEDVEAVQALWRLSNEVIADAEATLKAAGLVNMGALNEAAYRYGKYVEDAVAVAAALAGRDAEEVAENRLRLRALVVPKFPVSGADLLRKGMAPGKAVGLELARLERVWIDSGFALDRETLLDEISASR